MTRKEKVRGLIKEARLSKVQQMSQSSERVRKGIKIVRGPKKEAKSQKFIYHQPDSWTV